MYEYFIGRPKWFKALGYSRLRNKKKEGAKLPVLIVQTDHIRVPNGPYGQPELPLVVFKTIFVNIC
ncbi:hypothetical protein H6B30_09195 [Marseilla massiliensis]|uniref:Uncharacterized protein n=1 Tax=Marseilla massiliensis TaxID=1841864 RepID=A0A939B5C6_9BACT|nr:hypothetical protein [Marseilla massiliensis]